MLTLKSKSYAEGKAFIFLRSPQTLQGRLSEAISKGLGDGVIPPTEARELNNAFPFRHSPNSAERSD